MTTKHDLLFEIGTEELPPKDLCRLMNALKDNLAASLQEAGLSFQAVHAFAAPRRLAVRVEQLADMQPNRFIERKGPALNAAFAADGKPTKACEGFARSCGVTVEQLKQVETAQGAWVVYQYEEQGKAAAELLPEMLQTALLQLPVTKTMRWGNHATAFIRPIHWLVLLYGGQVIDATILGIKTSNKTRGHRFHCPQELTITKPAEYEIILAQQGKVIADFAKRQAIILQGIHQLAAAQNGTAVIEPALLDEVTALVEWPVPLLAGFEQQFLAVPKEALISAMQGHQKCFAVVDKEQKLLPYFITVSNIESRDPQQVIIGNERVMRARLSDADFFYQTDLKSTLASRCEGLKNVTFQAKLGTVFAKTQRIAALAEFIARSLKQCDAVAAKRAGELCKADLLSAMVGEFPELQGIMGNYYARHDGESEKVATAIQEHYLPRSANDILPASLEGCAVALADRLDTLVGLFGINQPPTGDKDPFGLRRAALGILKIIHQAGLDLSLAELLTHAAAGYGQTLANPAAVAQTQEFILERLRGLYQEQGIAADSLMAVLAVQNDNPRDIDYRVKAVQHFRQLPEAAALAAANKRVSNILAKLIHIPTEVKEALFELAQEKQLYQLIRQYQQTSQQDQRNAEAYTQQLQQLARLQHPIDAFFDQVMVMVDNPALQNNRLALLNAMRNLFLQVADISLLQI